jgi:hypothetical protein
MSAMRLAIVGAGMAGLSCASRLQALGLRPVLFDKGRGPAGRMASRRLATPHGEAVFDMGAQYFTVRNRAFAAQVSDWLAAGLVAPWPDAGPDAWVGAPSMAAPLKAMAADLDIRWGAYVGGVSREGGLWRLHLKDSDEGPFDAVVVALPAEQAVPLLALNDIDFMNRSARSVSQPCWTGLFAFDAPLETSSPVLRDGRVLAWAARNSSKPDRAGPEAWVAQAQPDWSQAHLEETPDAIAPVLLGELLRMTGSPGRTPIAAHAHRWRFAKSTGLGIGPLWRPDLRFGVCGDWLIAPRVESAWLSGFQLADQMLAVAPAAVIAGVA